MGVIKNMFIIFCVDHWNTLGILRSLRDKNISPMIILLQEGKKPYLVTSSNCKADIHIVYSLQEGYSLLLKYGNKDCKPFVLTGMDRIEAFLDNHFDELKNTFNIFNAGEQGRVVNLMNKEVQNELAESCGFTIIKSEIVNVGDLPQRIHYPLITKAIDSTVAGWKGYMHICYEEEDLLFAYSTMSPQKIMLQEYIEKKNEIAVNGLSINGGNNISIPLYLSYYRLKPDAYGSYIYIQKFNEVDLIDKIRKFFRLTHYNGIFEIEFIVDKKGKIFFMETNFRISAWVHGFAKCGLNLPYYYAKSVLKNEIECSTDKINKIPFVGMLEPSDFQAHVMNGEINLFKWLKELKNCDTYFYYDKKDKWPFYKMVFRNLSPTKLIRYFYNINK